MHFHRDRTKLHTSRLPTHQLLSHKTETKQHPVYAVTSTNRITFITAEENFSLFKHKCIMTRYIKASIICSSQATSALRRAAQSVWDFKVPCTWCALHVELMQIQGKSEANWCTHTVVVFLVALQWISVIACNWSNACSLLFEYLFLIVLYSIKFHVVQIKSKHDQFH